MEANESQSLASRFVIGAIGAPSPTFPEVDSCGISDWAIIAKSQLIEKLSVFKVEKLYIK
jgi:hypothetical protein